MKPQLLLLAAICSLAHVRALPLVNRADVEDIEHIGDVGTGDAEDRYIINSGYCRGHHCSHGGLFPSQTASPAPHCKPKGGFTEEQMEGWSYEERVNRNKRVRPCEYASPEEIQMFKDMQEHLKVGRDGKPAIPNDDPWTMIRKGTGQKARVWKKEDEGVLPCF